MVLTLNLEKNHAQTGQDVPVPTILTATIIINYIIHADVGIDVPCHPQELAVGWPRGSGSIGKLAGFGLLGLGVACAPPETLSASSPATVLTVPFLLLPMLLPSVFFLKTPAAWSSATLDLCASVMLGQRRQPPLHVFPHPWHVGM